MISAMSGCDDRTGICQEPVQEILVDKQMVHPKFDQVKMSNNIAMIKLQTPANLTFGNVRTICLPTEPGNQIENIGDEALQRTLIAGKVQSFSNCTHNTLSVYVRVWLEKAKIEISSKNVREIHSKRRVC